MVFHSSEGHRCKLKFQVADVETPSVSTADLTKAGNRVIFGDSDGYIENSKTGQKIKLHKKGNVYILRMWIREVN